MSASISEPATQNTATERVAGYAIAPQFIERWSPRAFSSETIELATLFSFFEAARWSPSGSNEQPWRFIYSLRGGPSWPKFLELLNDNNRLWARQAAALVLIVSRTVRRARDSDEEIPSNSHSFDAGAAWASLALQASLSGWATHAIGGFDRERARDVLAVPAKFRVEAIIAIGRRGERSTLPSALQQREAPNDRLPLHEIAFADSFPG